MRYGQISLFAISTAFMLYKVVLLDWKTKQLKRNVSADRREASVWLPVRLAEYCQQRGGTSAESLSPTVLLSLKFGDLGKYKNRQTAGSAVPLRERERMREKTRAPE